MKTPFEILGVEASFDLELGALEKRFRDLSKVHHPDRGDRALGASERSASERRESLGRAMDLNEAFRTLRDDLTRARAVLAARGVELGNEERSGDPDFLMEVMELREALGEARDKRDLATVQRLAQGVRSSYATARGALSSALTAHRDAEARSHLGRMRYYRRFLDEVDVIEEEAASAS